MIEEYLMTKWTTVKSSCESKMYKDFYRNGITLSNFGSDRLTSVLKSILEGDLKEGFSLDQKYSQTKDLRPDVISYDPVFMEVLQEFNIRKKIRDLTLRDLSLFHVQVRVVENNNSYMDWHRDTYYNSEGKLVGKAPHGVKLIYYPEFEEGTNDRLLYLVGSNRIVYPNNAYDRNLFEILPITKVESNNDAAVIFDVNGLHAVCPEKQDKKSIRLIYSFLDARQIEAEHANEELHIRTMKTFEEMK